MNLETITINLVDNYLSRFNIPLYSKILDISIRDHNLVILISKDITYTNSTKGVDIIAVRDISNNIYLPYWGSCSKNEVILSSSNGNNIDVRNISSLYYIFLRIEESLEEKREEKLKKIIQN